MTMSDEHKKLIGRLVQVIEGQHKGRHGTVLWIDTEKSEVCLQLSTERIVIELSAIDHEETDKPG